MRDAEDVITTAVNGHTDELAALYEVGLARMYQMLSTHCTYPKTKILIRNIGSLSKDGARLIKADLDAMFQDILGEDEFAECDAIALHKEAFEAVQACLKNKSKADRKQELRELIAVAQGMLAGVDREDEPRSLAPPAEVSRFARNGK